MRVVALALLIALVLPAGARADWAPAQRQPATWNGDPRLLGDGTLATLDPIGTRGGFTITRVGWNGVLGARTAVRAPVDPLAVGGVEWVVSGPTVAATWVDRHQARVAIFRLGDPGVVRHTLPTPHGMDPETPQIAAAGRGRFVASWPLNAPDDDGDGPGGVSAWFDRRSVHARVVAGLHPGGPVVLGDDQYVQPSGTLWAGGQGDLMRLIWTPAVGGRSRTVLLAHSTLTDFELPFASDRLGRQVVAWSQVRRVRVSVRAPGGRFSRPRSFGRGSNDEPALAVGRNGRAVIAWTEPRALVIAIGTTQGHWRLRRVPSTTYGTQGVTAAIDRHGVARVAWVGLSRTRHRQIFATQVDRDDRIAPPRRFRVRGHDCHSPHLQQTRALVLLTWRCVHGAIGGGPWFSTERV